MGDFKCPSLPDGGIEYMVIQRHVGGAIKGYIPRSCMEAVGVDTSPFDNGGTLWWRREQSEQMRAHRHFIATEDWPPPAVRENEDPCPLARAACAKHGCDGKCEQ